MQNGTSVGVFLAGSFCLCALVSAADAGLEVTGGGAIFSQSRLWVTNSGVELKALVTKIQANEVCLVSGAGNQTLERRLPIANLCPADQARVHVAYFAGVESQLLKEALPHLAQFSEPSGTALETFKRLHLDFPESPYGGLWAAVALNAEQNQFADASSILRQVIGRIEKQQQFDVSRHRTTLCSALNNLAVCMIKSHQPDAAAGLLSRALHELPQKGPQAIHNAGQLLALGARPGSLLSLSKSSQQKLTSELKRWSGKETGMLAGWYYSIDVDMPCFEIGSSSSQTLVSPIAGGVPVVHGIGLAVGPHQVVAVLEASKPDASPVIDAFSIQPFTDHSNQPLRVGRLDAKDQRSGLLLLQLESGSNLPAVSMQDVTLQANDDIAMFFQHGVSERQPLGSLKVLRGKLQSAQTGGADSYTVSLSVSGVGPIVNRAAEVIGFCHRDAAGRPIALTPTSMFSDAARTWMGKVTPAAQTQTFSDVQAACVAVVGWKKSQEVEQPAAIQTLAEHAEIASCGFRDPWCIACQGTATTPCPHCIGGSISVKKRVQISFNVVTGSPVFGVKSFKQRCTKCGGAGKFSCKYCKAGKL